MATKTRDKSKDLLKGLSKVRKFLDSIPYINGGGCGYSALAMYRWLEKHNYNMDEVSFTFLYISGDDSFSINEEFLMGLRAYPTSCSHVLIRIGDELYDSSGGLEFFKENWYVANRHDYLDIDFLLLSLKYGEWNDLFDRHAEIPKIAEKFSIELKIIK